MCLLVSSISVLIIAKCRFFLLSASSSIVRLLRLTFTRIGTTMTVPCIVTSILAGPVISRLDRGGITISSSSGCCDSHWMLAPLSTCPTSISNTVALLPSLLREYFVATSRAVVVLISPYSTTPLHPFSSDIHSCVGSLSPARPRYTFLLFVSEPVRMSLITPDTTAWIVVTYLFVCESLNPSSPHCRRTALYFMYIGPVNSLNATTSVSSKPALTACSCLRNSHRATAFLLAPPGYALPCTGSLTNSHSREGLVRTPP
mmetsp:Transcript_1128/g.2652  ORF Transcript_1128/g.2652 Transcript_1128/m.2652 type:complete len:259 (-) Transcript_1128:458-1234(-)